MYNGIIHRLTEKGKGILAADESTPTIKKRFDGVGVDCTNGTRHSYRHSLFSSSGLENYISGIILFDETIRNKKQYNHWLTRESVWGLR